MEFLYDVRRMDDLGRLVVPASIRRKLAWDVNTDLEIVADEKCVFLRRRKENCALCGNESDLVKFGGNLICKSCIDMLKK